MPRSQSEKTKSAGAEVVNRLQLAYDVTTLQGLADALHEGESTVKNWRYRGRVPMKYLLKASEDTKRSVDWFLTGHGYREVPPRPRPGPVDAVLNDGTLIEAKLVVSEPDTIAWRWDAAAAAAAAKRPTRSGGRRGPGQGALLPVTDESHVQPLVLQLSLENEGANLNYEVIPRLTAGKDLSAAASRTDRAGELAMSFSWLERHLHHTSGQLATWQVLGDSMSPTLLDGETIIIDRGVRGVVVDDIYVVDMLGQRLVKRLQRKTDGSLVIISDNQAYEREMVPRNRIGEIHVVGRKVWPRTR